MTSRRVLLALWGTAAALAAPWAVEALLVALRRTSWRTPAVPRFRINLERLTP